MDGSVFVLVVISRDEGQRTGGLNKPYSWTARIFSLELSKSGLLASWPRNAGRLTEWADGCGSRHRGFVCIPAAARG